MNKKGSLQLNPLFRRMEEKDIPKVMKMGKEAPGSAVTEETSFWTEEELRGWIKESNDPMIMAEVNGKIAGYLLARIHHPTHNAIIENFLVQEEYQSKGIGSQLLNQCLEDLKKQNVVYVYIAVHLEDKELIDFMTRQGFYQGKKFLWLEKLL